MRCAIFKSVGILVDCNMLQGIFSDPPACPANASLRESKLFSRQGKRLLMAYITSALEHSRLHIPPSHLLPHAARRRRA